MGKIERSGIEFWVLVLLVAFFMGSLEFEFSNRNWSKFWVGSGVGVPFWVFA